MANLYTNVHVYLRVKQLNQIEYLKNNHFWKLMFHDERDFFYV